jgi:aspartyl-tRNA(Asn)/glutamyl-tRNA(Gln) amidotransferase subunit A
VFFFFFFIDALSGVDEKDFTSIEFSESPHKTGDVSSTNHIKGIRVGVPQEYHVEGLSEASLSAWNGAAQFLESQGAEIVPISLPHTSLALPAYYIIAPAEASSNLSRYDGVRFGQAVDQDDSEGGPLFSPTRTALFGDEVKRRIILGTFVLSAK